MSAFPIYQIAQITATSHSETAMLRPFRIMETNLTIDGPRSRICDGSWATQEQAEAALKEKIDGPQKSD